MLFKIPRGDDGFGKAEASGFLDPLLEICDRATFPGKTEFSYGKEIVGDDSVRKRGNER